MTREMMDDSTVECFVGPAQSGRTAHALRCAADAAECGRRVVFVCARERDVEGARRRLALAGGASAGVRVATAPELALEILASPEGHALFGRSARPRLLEPYEETILLEDLKVSQMRNRRLRQVLTYLYAGWENLADDDWEQTPEEDLVIARLHDNLRFSGGVLRCEAANLALKVVRSSDRAAKAFGWDCVVVDDFELLDRASQHLARALACGRLVVAAGDRPGLAGDDAYPCHDGVCELLRDRPAAKVVRLGAGSQSAQVRSVLDRLANDEAVACSQVGEPEVVAEPGAVAAACPSVDGHGVADGDGVGSEDPASADGCGDGAVRVLPSLEAELQAIAEASAAALERGEDVLIVGTDRLWRRNVAANLAHVGLPVDVVAAKGIRVRDLRDARQCERAAQDALSRLARDAGDGVAWRTLVALGDSVGRSAAIDRLRQAVCGPGADGAAIGLPAALERLLAGEVEVDELGRPLLEDLRAAYAAAKEALSQVAVADGPSAGVAGESGGVDGREAPGIRVCSPDGASGLRADCVIFGGFVNGLIPCRAYFDPAGLAGNARLRERRDAARRVFGVASCARKQVLFTAFSSCSLQAAETMDVHIASIKLRRGLRVALTEPSILGDPLR